jgi:hypothetical protein
VAHRSRKRWWVQRQTGVHGTHTRTKRRNKQQQKFNGETEHTRHGLQLALIQDLVARKDQK